MPFFQVHNSYVQIALVGQEPVLYARSVTENIGYGLEGCTTEQIENVSLQRRNRLRQGFMTDVGAKPKFSMLVHLHARNMRS